LSGPTFTMRSTIEIAERLARRLIGNVAAYWACTTYSDQVLSLAPGAITYLPTDGIAVVVDCDAKLSLILGWTQTLPVAATVEIPVNQLAVVSSALAAPYIRNAASTGTPSALARIITLS